MRERALCSRPPPCDDASLQNRNTRATERSRRRIAGDLERGRIMPVSPQSLPLCRITAIPVKHAVVEAVTSPDSCHRSESRGSGVSGAYHPHSRIFSGSLLTKSCPTPSSGVCDIGSLAFTHSAGAWRDTSVWFPNSRHTWHRLHAKCPCGPPGQSQMPCPLPSALPLTAQHAASWESHAAVSPVPLDFFPLFVSSLSGLSNCVVLGFRTVRPQLHSLRAV